MTETTFDPGLERTKEFRPRSGGHISERRDEVAREIGHKLGRGDRAYQKGLGEKGAVPKELRRSLAAEVTQGIADSQEEENFPKKEKIHNPDEKENFTRYVASPFDASKIPGSEQVKPKRQMPLKEANWLNKIWNFARRGGNR